MQKALNNHFGDRLVHAIREKDAPVCVGLDPLIERLPSSLLHAHGVRLSGDHVAANAARSPAIAALREYCLAVIGVVAELVPAVKLNIAFFERYGPEGLRVYGDLVAASHDAGLVVIGDVKRADIGHSAAQYAYAHLEPHNGPASMEAADAVTVNPYFGWDGVAPFVEVARKSGRGLFVLVQTSNASAKEVQGLRLSDGTILCHAVGALVQGWATADGLVGESGYSSMGAVVSPRDLPSTEQLRTLMPNCLFLVPGFGAQGRTADEVARCFRSDGSGAIVTASRSVIYAYDEPLYRERIGNDWKGCISQACADFLAAVRRTATA